MAHRAPPDRRYSLIYADPPWHFEQTGKKGCVLERGGRAKYKQMTFDEMTRIEIPAEDDCVMLMWAVASDLRKCVALLQAWDFTYKGIEFVWHKTYASGKSFQGVGGYTAPNVEFVLLGTRGTRFLELKPSELHVNSVRPGLAHSEKPQKFRDLAFAVKEGLKIEGRPLEMFTRGCDSRFDVTGDQVEKFAGLEENREQFIRATHFAKVKGVRWKKAADAHELTVQPRYVTPPEPLKTSLKELVGQNKYDVVILELHSVAHSLALEIENMARTTDFIVFFETTQSNFHLWIDSFIKRGFVYVSVSFYAFNSDDSNDFRIYCAVRSKDTHIKKFKIAFPRQTIEFSDTNPGEEVRNRVRTMFGETAAICAIRSTCENDFCMEDL